LEARLLLSGTIEGQVWRDYDADGVRDAGEHGLNGWTVELVDVAGGGVVDTQTTADVDLDGNGSIDSFTERGLYAFTGVADGDYEVRQVPPSDIWRQTSPNQFGGELDVFQYVNDGDSGADLDAIWEVTASPDGQYVYTISRYSNALTVFERDAGTGELTAVQVLRDELHLQLNYPLAMAVSPDGNHLYVSALNDDLLNVLQRDPSTGLLSVVQVLADGEGGIEGLDTPQAVAVSGDGLNVYVGSIGDGALATFARDPVTGLLTQTQVLFQGVGGVSGLYGGPRELAVAPDGQHVYAIGRTSSGPAKDCMVTFARDAGTGALTFVEKLAGGEPMFNASGMAVSPDGLHVYVTATTGGSVSVFDRSGVTGTLTLSDRYQAGVGQIGADELTEPSAVAISPDGLYAFVAWYGGSDGGVMSFQRDAATGALDRLAAYPQEVSFPARLALAPDGRDLYVGDWNDALVGLARLPEPIDYELGLAGQTETGVDFSNALWSSASGQLFYDGDGSGFQDPGELGLDGWTVQLVRSDYGYVVDETVTTSVDLDGSGSIDPVTESGLYAFEIARTGAHEVRLVAPDGWMATTPNPPVYNLGFGHGTTYANRDFGAVESASVYGYVFEDDNGNGAWAAGRCGWLTRPAWSG